MLLDSTQWKIQRELSDISQWLHASHFGTTFLSSADVVKKDKIISDTMKMLIPYMIKFSEILSKRVDDMEVEIFKLFEHL